MGGQRERFLRESLLSLQSDLAALGQGLLTLETDPRAALPQLVTAFDIERVITSAARRTHRLSWVVHASTSSSRFSFKYNRLAPAPQA